MFTLTARIRHDDNEVRRTAIGNKRLRAINDPAIAVFLGIGFHILKVRARTRLRHSNRADKLARSHARQPFLLLLFRAEMQNIRRDNGIMKRETKAVDIGFDQLFHDNHFMAVVSAAAAIFRWDGAIQQAHLARHIPIFAVDHFILAKTFRMRRHFARIKAMHSFAEDIYIFLVIPLWGFEI